MDKIFSGIQSYAGWARVRVGKFEGRCSYLRDPVCDLAYALVNAKKTGGGVARFDEEGSVFDIVFSDGDVYVVSQRDKARFYDTDLSLDEFAEEFVKEVREDIELWKDWDSCGKEDDYEKLKKEAEARIKELLSMVESTFGMKGLEDVEQVEER